MCTTNETRKLRKPAGSLGAFLLLLPALACGGSNSGDAGPEAREAAGIREAGQTPGAPSTGDGGTAPGAEAGEAAAIPIPPSPSAVLPPLRDGEITLVAMPDIQWYSLSEETILPDEMEGSLGDFLAHFERPGQGPATLRALHEWILREQQAQRIGFVSYMGDIVERGRDETSRKRWEEVRRNIDQLHGRVPYGIGVGNHDMETGSGNTDLFEEFFGEARYRDFAWYGGSYQNNVNSYQFVEHEGSDLMFLHLTCNAPDDALDWADDVLADHPDHHAFITTHMLLGPIEGNRQGEEVGLMEWTKCYGDRGRNARESWDRIFSRHANVKALLSGDQSYYQAGHVVAQGAQGNAVHLIMSDYKQISSDGYLRLMRYHPVEGTMQVITYSPILDRILENTDIVPQPELHNFSVGW